MFERLSIDFWTVVHTHTHVQRQMRTHRVTFNNVGFIFLPDNLRATTTPCGWRSLGSRKNNRSLDNFVEKHEPRAKDAFTSAQARGRCRENITFKRDTFICNSILFSFLRISLLSFYTLNRLLKYNSLSFEIFATVRCIRTETFSLSGITWKIARTRQICVIRYCATIVLLRGAYYTITLSIAKWLLEDSEFSISTRVWFSRFNSGTFLPNLLIRRR